MRRRALLAGLLAALVVLSGCSAVGGLTGSSADGPGVDTERKLQFENATAEAGLNYHGGAIGVGAGNNSVYSTDANNDGWTDLLAVGSGTPVLYLNQDGEFERSASFPAVRQRVKSASVVDYDGDGWDDILLFPVDSRPVVLHNDEGSFERTTVGLGNLTYPLGATAADYDGDGDRDLFVYQSGNWADRRPAGYYSINKSIADDNGNPNVLYENTGQSGADRFRRVTDAGIAGERWSLAASFVDLTGDGRPDIHVANDYNNDSLYINQGNGTFEFRPLGGPTARNGMASEIADVNGDGLPDIFVTNILIPVDQHREQIDDKRYKRIERMFSFVLKSQRAQGNTLLINQGGGEFEDRATQYNVRTGGWGWAASLTDFDNDGDRDLIHTTQNVVRINRSDPVYTYPMVWQRNATSFDRVREGTHGMDPHNSRGMTTLDYDRDGDRDVVIANYDGPLVLYENTVQQGKAVQFQVVDENGATVLGATVTVEAGGRTTTVRQTVQNDFFSQESDVLHVGIGDAETATLKVTRPDGSTATYEVDADTRYRITPDGIETVANLTSADAGE